MKDFNNIATVAKYGRPHHLETFDFVVMYETFWSNVLNGRVTGLSTYVPRSKILFQIDVH